MKLHELKERRGQLTDEMRSLHDQAQKEDRDLTAEEAEKFEALKVEERKVATQIDRAEYMAETERRMAGDRQEKERRGLAEGFSVTKAIAAQLNMAGVDAGREQEVSQELARRRGKTPTGIMVPIEALETRAAVTKGGSGGNLVGDDYRPDLFVDALRDRLIVGRLGATILNDLTQDLVIPRLTGTSTAYWVGEGGAVTESDHTFDQITMEPKTVGARVQYSRKMMVQASPAVESLVRGDLARVLAVAIDRVAINGGGSNEPTGVLQTSGIGDVSATGYTPSWSNVLGLEAEVANDNALMGTLGFAMNHKAAKLLRSTVRVSGTDSRFIMDEPGRLAGYPVQLSNAVPANFDSGESPTFDASPIVFGNWADLIVGYWTGVEILVNPYETNVYAKGGVLISAMVDCDVAVRHPESFAAITNVDAG